MLRPLVLAASCLTLGILIGKFTAGGPGVAAPRQTAVPIIVKPGSSQPQGHASTIIDQNLSRPSLAIKGHPEPLSRAGPSEKDEAEPKPVVILNPGTADVGNTERAPAAREVSPSVEDPIPIREKPAQLKNYPGVDSGRESSARDYHALRDYMLSR